MEKGYYYGNVDFLVRLSKANKDGLNWMVLLLLSLSSSSPSWSSSLMYGGERSGSGCDPFTSRQMWSQFYLPVKQVPEPLLQDAWRFADPLWVWWRYSCRHGTTANGRVVFSCAHWAFPYYVGVKLIEVKQVNRKWSWGRDVLQTFSGLRSLSLQGRLHVSLSLTWFTYVLGVLSRLHGDVILETQVTVSGDAADNMSYLRVTAEVRLHLRTPS
jgi:hypothetical protein